MSKRIAVLATLDTKGQEAEFIRDQIERLGSQALIIDIGVMGEPATTPDISREEVARRGGSSLAAVLENPSREAAQPIFGGGVAKILIEMIEADTVHGVLGLGGLQGTAVCTQAMRDLPYGFPKVMVSTVASGDTSAYVDIKDIAMLFSVSDILGLNPFTRKILAKAAGAVHGMAQVDDVKVQGGDKPLIGMSNLGVLTRGAQKALEYFNEKGYEVIVFHAVGSGGRAMEQMMKEGIIGGVFDYAMGEIADEHFEGLRAGGPERLTVAGKLGIPQVLCPGGAEHLGVLVNPPNTVPDRYKDHQYVFHNPIVFVPRLRKAEMVELARDIADRLQHTKGQAVFMMPTDGTGSYAMEGGVLRDTEADAAFFAELKERLPDTIEVVERHTHAEDPEFVKECVDRLIAMIEG